MITSGKEKQQGFSKWSLFAALLIAFFSSIGCAGAQQGEKSSAFTISGYLELYYQYDFGKPTDHNRPGFVYSFNRHHEVNLNLGFVKATYQTERVRGNLALMTGTYANANLAAEPGVLKNIFEANAGVKLSRESELWLDAGIFASHIGFESAVGSVCWNLTRSMLADNSPYYESGAKLSYTSHDSKWFVSGLLLNGWQRIQRIDGNNTPAFGHQLTFTPNDKILLNSSSFIGSDSPDSTRLMRYFHNFYGQFQPSERLGMIVGFDFGAQQVAKEGSAYYTWFSPVLIARYALSEKWALAARGEYYSDKNQVIITSGTPRGFQTTGISLNLDYQINEVAKWRVEAKGYESKDKVFQKVGDVSKQNFLIATSLSLAF